MDDSDEYSSSRSKFLEPETVSKPLPRFPGFKLYVIMSGLVTVAALSALGQHTFYNYLHNREISINQAPFSQSWAIRVFCHAFWHVVRQKAIRLGGLEAMFGVLNDPLKFTNRDLLFQAKTLFVLAVISWVLPIAAILSRGALTGMIPTALISGAQWWTEFA
jgi:hypothetical protein